MSQSFEDKIALVTGGSRGIGRGIAQAFAQAGATVTIAAASPENLERAKAAIREATGQVVASHAADLRTLEGCASLHAAIQAAYGRLDILVSSAGATKAGSFLSLADELWADGFALKFQSFVRLTRLFWPMLVEAQGHVVAINGGAARTPDPDFLIGGAVNAAMHNFNKGLSGLGRRDGVNVNAILPGLTATERVEQLFAQRAAANNTTIEAVREEQIARFGLTRLATPEDIAALTLFLCSDAARHIQGTAIAVDGGQTAGVY